MGCPGGPPDVLRARAVLWGKGVTRDVQNPTEPLQGLRARGGFGGLRAQGQQVTLSGAQISAPGHCRFVEHVETE